MRISAFQPASGTRIATAQFIADMNGGLFYNAAMIDRRQFSQLEGLMFVARRLVEGLYAGSHATPQAGPGVEFHDYRSYVPGDSPASIDWKLFGRTDRLYIRRHRWFADFNAMIMLDCSASMHFAGLDEHGRQRRSTWNIDQGSGTPQTKQVLTKLEYGLSLAAAIAFLVIRQSDRVGAGVYAHDLIRHRPIGSTWAHLHNLCHMLENTKPVQGIGQAGSGLYHAHQLLRRGSRSRGIVILISDLLEDPNGENGLFDGINRLRHDRHDVIVFQVLTPEEIDLARLGQQRMKMVDLESRQQVRTYIPQVQQRYAELIQSHVNEIRRGCTNRGVDYNLMTTDRPVMEGLRRYVMRRVGK